MKKITVVFDIGYIYTVETHSIPKTGVHRAIVKTIELLRNRSNINLFFYINCPQGTDHESLKNFVQKIYRESHLHYLKGVKVINWEFSNRSLNFLERLTTNLPRSLSNIRLFSIVLRIFRKFLKKLNDKYILRRVLKEIGNDTFIYHQPWLLMEKRPFGQQAKYFFTIYDLIPLKVEELKKDREWFEKMLGYAYPKSDHFLSISHHTKKDLLEYNPLIPEKNVTVSHLAADEKFAPIAKEICEQTLAKYQIKSNQKFFLGIRATDPRKNYEIALDAFFQWITEKKIPDLAFLLLSSQGIRLDNLLEKYPHEMRAHLRQKVIVTSYIDEHDLPVFYSSALCFIYPSLYEGFGLPVLESLQCGTAVITSNTSSIPEITGNAGLLVRPDSVEDFKAAYKKIYHSPELRKNLIENGIIRAGEFSWEKYLKITLDSYYSKL